MAGRGTDIILGGNAEYMAKEEMKKLGYYEDLISEATAYGDTNDSKILEARETFKDLNDKYKKIVAEKAEEVKAAGGLFIIGTERHESRRIDNQLRGRSGRQGDPGESRFYLSLEDNLMRLYGGAKVDKMMQFLGVDEDMPIMAPIGAAPALRLSMKDAKFKRYLAGVDSQELFREVTGGLVCHVGSVSICRQRWIFVLPECGIYDTLIRHIRRLAG